MNAFAAETLQLGMKYRDVAVAYNPFRLFNEFVEVKSVDDADCAVTSSYTENSIDVVAVDMFLNQRCTGVVVASKLVVRIEKALVIDKLKSSVFYIINGERHFVFSDFPRRCNQ